jgi:hypothetical protein
MEEPDMANLRNPNAPYDPDRLNDPPRTDIDPDMRAPTRLEGELQADPELAESPASSGKIALFAIGIAVLLGAVFYGLNNSSTHQNGTSSTAQNPAPATAQNTTPTSPPAAPPGMRDVTPRGNSGPGVTTGAAPAPAAPANNVPASK